VLHWIKETSFFKKNHSSIEVFAQFPLGEYIKQLDRRYKHAPYVVDFLLLYTDDQEVQHKIIIEYDGFEFHFQDHGSINEFNYDQYYTSQHVYREKVLESYGYNFVRINRFNVGKEPIEMLNNRLETIVKKKSLVLH
jgi:very-short-patch-repair endonuclease